MTPITSERTYFGLPWEYYRFFSEKHSCGIYSGMAAIESIMIKNGMADNTIDLSESHFSWFTYGKGSSDDPDDPLYGNGQILVQAFAEAADSLANIKKFI